MLDCDQYLLPQSLDEAFDLIATHGSASQLVAGATDLLPWAREGRAGDVHIPVLIDITRSPDLNGVSKEGNRIRLGAATVFQKFLKDPILREHAPVMPHVAVWFADDQLRQSATIGGNLVNASPAADGTPGLMALDAELVLFSRADGERRVSVTEFPTGPSKSVLRDGELIIAVEFDSASGYGASFEKVGHRRSLVISTVCAATALKLDASGEKFEDVRIALAGVGPVPVRLSECEDALRGKPVTAAVIEAAANLPLDRVQSRTRQDYRREVVVNFVRRGIVDALASVGCDIEPSETRELETANG
jgi:carbon-monoxide dehydrogenase medium subunit/xanthine dehydrogenase FAD-binding subunit